MDYDLYNREERYICSHLFRLLHEPMDGYRVLRTFLRMPAAPSRFRIFTEVALIRDAYRVRFPVKHTSMDRPVEAVRFMDDMVRLIMQQEQVASCRLYSQVLREFPDLAFIHPREIKLRAGSRFSTAEERVYGAMQGMFNAKPDLAICLERSIVIYEAKLTSRFNKAQMERTKNISAVWAKLLYADLGFEEAPDSPTVLELGFSKSPPHVSWEFVFKLAESVYPPSDRTRMALKNALRFKGAE